MFEMEACLDLYYLCLAKCLLDATLSHAYKHAYVNVSELVYSYNHLINNTTQYMYVLLH